LYKNKAQKLQENKVLDFNNRYSLKLSNSKASLLTLSKLRGKGTSDLDVEDKELSFSLFSN